MCICELIPELTLKTRVSLIVHAKELKRTTNTGRLALQALKNSEMHIRGETTQALDLSDLLTAEYRPLFFYPSEEAVELTEQLVSEDPRPIHLFVPDGNWRQAGKVHSRHPELANVQRVKISRLNEAKYHLRAEHRPEGMSTLEAIARALGVIEGNEVMERLLALYQSKLERTLAARGVPITSAANYSFGSGI